MKKHFILMVFAVMLSLVCVTRSYATDVVTDNNSTSNELRVQEMKSRLEEIKNMDKSNLTREERKELRREVKGMRKEAKTMSGGVYLSVGAIIIIILVLILIL
ncbi:MAG TPA: hypothetical protein VG738_19750 [Chitinophagaceae bacterium]|nr:hypothetical protein [Chitinophagaceae bacterium]